jgi:YVTN family beta-propeller protein
LGELSTIPAGDEVEGDYIGEMKFTRNGNEIWALNRTTDNITVIDWATQTIIHDIPVGDMPMDIDFSENYAVVACHFSHDVYFISLQNYSVEAVKAVSAKPAKVHVSQAGNIAVVGCDENDVAEVFDLNTFEKILTIPDFPVYLYKFAFITSNPRNSVYFSNFRITPDEAYVANGAGEDGLQFWDLATGALSATIPEAGNSGQIELSVDGTTLVAMKAANPGVVTQIDVVSQSFLKQMSIPTTVSSSFSPPAVNANGRKALVPTLSGGNTALIDFETETWQYVNTGNTPDWVGRNEDGSLFIAGDYYLAVIDAETGAILSSLNGTSIQNGAIGKGNRIVATDPLRYEWLEFYEFENPGVLNAAGQANTGSYYEADATYSVKFTPDEKKLLAVNSLSGTLSVIDVETEQLEAIIPLGSSEIFQVSITPDGQYALVALRLEDKVAIVDLETHQVVAKVPSGGSRPDQVFLPPFINYAYVVNAGGADNIGVIALNGANSSLFTTIPIGNTGVSWTNYGIRSDLKFFNNYALLAAPFDNKIQVIDMQQHQVVQDIPLQGFPLQISVNSSGNGYYAAVTLKDANQLAVLKANGWIWEVVDIESCGQNPTRTDMPNYSKKISVISHGDKKVQTYSIIEGEFVSEVQFPGYTPLAILHDIHNRAFTLWQSDDPDSAPHRIGVGIDPEDPVFYDLPALPIHHFDINYWGTLIAIPHPATDEVTLLREDMLYGYRQTVISLRPQPYHFFPNPVVDALHFQLRSGNEPINDAVFRLFDANGKVLSEQTCGGTSFSITRQAGWTAGTYFYEIIRRGERVQGGKVMLR